MPLKSADFIQIRRRQLDWWKKELGKYWLTDITPALFIEARDKLFEKTYRGTLRAESTVNRYRAALNHVLNFCVKQWQWLPKNPIHTFGHFNEPDGVIRYLSDKERQALIEACKESENPALHVIVVLAISTGARQMEILKLRWRNVDLERGMIYLYKTKNKKSRSIPLASQALVLMKEYASKNYTKTNGFVFPAKNKIDKPLYIRTLWEKALRKADISDFRFHDLRHTSASYLAMNGATTLDIARILGHKTVQMAECYAHLSKTHINDVVAKMNAKIFEGSSEEQRKLKQNAELSSVYIEKLKHEIFKSFMENLNDGTAQDGNNEAQKKMEVLSVFLKAFNNVNLNTL